MRTAMKSGSAALYLYGFYRKEKAWPSPGANREREAESQPVSIWLNWFQPVSFSVDRRSQTFSSVGSFHFGADVV